MHIFWNTSYHHFYIFQFSYSTDLVFFEQVLDSSQVLAHVVRRHHLLHLGQLGLRVLQGLVKELLLRRLAELLALILGPLGQVFPLTVQLVHDLFDVGRGVVAFVYKGLTQLGEAERGEFAFKELDIATIFMNRICCLYRYFMRFLDEQKRLFFNYVHISSLLQGMSAMIPNLCYIEIILILWYFAHILQVFGKVCTAISDIHVDIN